MSSQSSYHRILDIQ